MISELLDNKEKLVQNSQIAIATTINYPEWYSDKPSKNNTDTKNDKIRGDLFLKMVQSVIKKGFQLVIVDSSNNSSLTKKLNELEIAPFSEKQKGMSLSRQQAFREASKLEGIKVIVWTEPEKVSMIKDCLPLAALPILSEEADIVVPQRNSHGFSSLPNYQAASEMLANQNFNKMLLKFAKEYKDLFPKNIPILDIFFGVKLFKNTPELLDIFTTKYTIKNLSPKEEKMNPDLYNNALNFPIIKALNEGYIVKSVSIPYLHPIEQKEFEKDNPEFVSKRKNQFYGILRSCVMFCRYLAKEETRIIRIS